MSNRPEPLTAAEQADLGRIVAAMREAGMLWKQIAGELGLCERHLRRCLLMSGKDAAMSDRGDCENRAAA